MKVNLEDAGPCRKRMHVTASAGETGGDYEIIVRAFAARGRVPGFRPGKAPRKVLEAHYARTIAETAKERLVPRFYRQALAQAGVTPVAIVGVEKVDFGRDAGLSFDVVIDVPPEFRLPHYRRVALTRRRKDVSDEQVEAAINRLRDNRAQYPEVTGRAVAPGDLAQVDYRGRCDGKGLAEVAGDASGLAEGKDFWVATGQRDLLPGLNAGLQGMQIGETREITVEFPPDYHVPGLAGRRTVYSVTVKAVREKQLPPLEKDFFTRCGVGSEEELRARVREELERSVQREQTAELRQQIARFLISKTDFDLPASLVEEEMHLAVQSIVERNLGLGLTSEQLQGHEDRILAAATQASRERVKLGYILSRIAAKEDVRVDPDEVEARIGAMAQRCGLSAGKLRAELEKRNAIERLENDIRTEKTMDFLLEHAKIRDA